MNTRDRIKKILNYCREHNITSEEFYARGLDKTIIVEDTIETVVAPTQKVESMAPQPVKTPIQEEKSVEDIIIDELTLLNSRVPTKPARVAIKALLERQEGITSLEELTTCTKRILKASNQHIPNGTPLIGFVANEVYKYAFTRKDEIEIPDQVVNKKVQFALKKHEINKLIKTSFDNESLRRIIGYLNSQTVQELYTKTDEGFGVFSDKTISIEGIETWDGQEKQKTREKILDMIQSSLLKKYDKNENKTSFTYFGLEGPNMRSYFEIRSYLLEHGYALKGHIVEYDYRKHNLMKSLLEHSGLSNEVKLFHQDINNMVLMGFVKDKFLHVTGRANTFRIYDRQESLMSYKQFKEIQEHYDNGASIQNIKRLLPKFGATTIQRVIERENPKYDIAFFDYIGKDNTKRRLVLSEFLENRIEDEAVVMVTSNLSSHMIGRITPMEVMEQQFDFVYELPHVEVINFDTHIYSDKKVEMGFLALHVRKEKEL